MKTNLINNLLALSICLIATNAIANDRYNNSEAQGVWKSAADSPALEVFIKGSSIYAKLGGKSQDLPAIRLRKINNNLLNEYTNEYIRLEDYNRDGLTDIAVLKSVGKRKNKHCYSVFEYKADFYSFSSHATKTICVE